MIHPSNPFPIIINHLRILESLSNLSISKILPISKYTSSSENSVIYKRKEDHHPPQRAKTEKNSHPSELILSLIAQATCLSNQSTRVHQNEYASLWPLNRRNKRHEQQESGYQTSSPRGEGLHLRFFLTARYNILLLVELELLQAHTRRRTMRRVDVLVHVYRSRFIGPDSGQRVTHPLTSRRGGREGARAWVVGTILFSSFSRRNFSYSSSTPSTPPRQQVAANYHHHHRRLLREIRFRVCGGTCTKREKFRERGRERIVDGATEEEEERQEG